MHMPLVLTNRRRRGGSASVPAFSPTTLYSSGAQGIWLDPSDLSTMFSDRAGTTPVTTPGTVVGLRLDKSKGLTLGADIIVNGNFATDTAWTKGAGWAIGGGVATYTPGGGAFLSQAVSSIAGKWFQMTLTVTQGQIVILGSQYIQNITLGVGTHTIPVSPAYNTIPLYASILTTIDNISVRELAGNHAVAPTDAARPIYGVEPKGGRRNLLTWSEDFGNAVWDIGGITVSTNLVASPVGDVTADKLVENTLYSDHVIYNDNPGITALAGSYTSSAYLKAAGRGFGFVQVAVNGAATRYGVVVDLSTGAVTATSTVGAPTGIAYNVASAGNGWWRISATATHTSGNIYFVSGPSSTGTPSYNPSGTPIYTGDNTSGVFIWGAQLERDA